MSLTIKTAPTNNASISNEMLFVIYESLKANDPTTYPDYRYVLDLYVNDVFATRIKSRPDPTYKMGVFDVSKMLQGYATYGFKANYGSYDVYTPYVSYKVKLGEEYGDTTYLNLVEDSSSRTAFISYEVRPFTESDVIDGIPEGFATRRPAVTFGYKESKWDIASFYANTSGVSDVFYTFYTPSGQIANSISNGGYVGKSFKQFNFSFVNLAALAGLSTSQKNAVTAVYVDPVGSGIGKLINYQCTKYTPVTLAWLNPYGAYDSYAFGLVSKKTIELTKKDYARLPYSINASGEVSYAANGVFYGGRRGYASNVRTQMKLTSHLLTGNEYTWLGELFASPDIYIFDKVKDKFIPVSIVDTTYEYRDYKNSKLTALEFSVNFADSYNTQNL